MSMPRLPRVRGGHVPNYNQPAQNGAGAPVYHRGRGGPARRGGRPHPGNRPPYAVNPPDVQPFPIPQDMPPHRGGRGSRGSRGGRGGARGGTQGGNAEFAQGISEHQRIELSNVILSKFNPAAPTILNLSSFCSSLGSFGPAASFSNTVFVKILLECLGQLCPKVESLSLAGNDIVGLHCIRALHSALPALKNLDLSGNRISSLSDSLIAYKFQLSELVLTNNPVVNDALPALYHREVKSFFPALKMLDQKPMLSSVLNFTVPAESLRQSLPVSAASCFPQFNEEQKQLLFTFVNSFLNCYDSNRNSLIDAYGQESMFSLSLVADGRIIRNSANETQAYLNLQHDLLALPAGDPFRSNRLFSTKMNIINALNTLPASRHRMDSLLMDAFQLQTRSKQVVQVIIHGVFEEPEYGMGRNFTRTFVLGTAESKMFPFSIYHDQLHVGSPIAIQFAAQPQPLMANQGGPYVVQPITTMTYQF